MDLRLSVLSVLCLVSVARGATCPPHTSDPSPASVDITTFDASLPTPHPSGCSEVVDVPTMGPFSDGTWPRENCPHDLPDLTDFETAHPALTSGSDVEITGAVLLKSCSIEAGVVLNRITVRTGGVLVVDDSDVTLEVREIIVEEGASFLAGSETCRRYGTLDIIFHGTSADSTHTNWDLSRTSKGLLSRGTVDLHGKRYHPTWTRLARTAAATDTVIYLQDAVNWEVGQEVLVTTTSFYDCPDNLAEEWCRMCNSWETCDASYHQNEILTVASVMMDSSNGHYALEFTTPLQHTHYGGSEYQAEVALLSRRITLSGVDSGDDFGGHTLQEGTAGAGRYSGVRATNMGQLNVLARYPFHFHLQETNGAASYAQECVVTDSHFRGYVVHGTSGSRLSRNVAYNVKGMCYYLEDGVEEDNLLEYNLAAHVHPIYRPADGGWGQGGETFFENSELTNPADTSASGFYIPNAYNDFIGNAASGGWSGFAFPNVATPLGVYRGEDRGDLNPEVRPTKRFHGNSAHSTGFYWSGHGSCFYVGADLGYDAGGAMFYNSGRHERRTKTSSGQKAWMIFEDTKAALCNTGVAHWGSEVELHRFEAHDILKGAMLFGEAAIDDAVFTARTANEVGFSVHPQTSRLGFQFYDTWTKSILSRVTFRGYKEASGDFCVIPMTHSDQFLPQGINSVRDLIFEDTDEAAVMEMRDCGPPRCTGGESTQSARIFSALDFDGSYSLTGRPTIVGSFHDWWNDGEGCTFHDVWNRWLCDWSTSRQTVYLSVGAPDLYDGCDSGVSSCDNQNIDYTVGTMVLWGSTSRLELSPWRGITGHSNRGWHWRVTSAPHGIDGAPSFFNIGNLQIPREHFVVLSVSYPSDTTFQVRVYSPWFGSSWDNLPMSDYATVTSPVEDLFENPDDMTCGATHALCSVFGPNAVGPAWHFDGTNLYVRVVKGGCYVNGMLDWNCYEAYYEHDGIKVWDIEEMIRYEVTATCSSCTVQASHGSVQYYDVEDSPPSSPFPGVSHATLMPVEDNGRTTSRVCDPSAPVATCDDGLMNQGELGVDCGGPCEPCSAGTTAAGGATTDGSATDGGATSDGGATTDGATTDGADTDAAGVSSGTRVATSALALFLVVVCVAVL